MRQRLNTIVFAALVSALAVAGLAIAQGDGDGGGEKGAKVKRMHHPGPPPGMLGEHGGGKLTYGELHVRRDGEDVTVRIDRGKVTEADDDSVTLERNDGQSVEIAVDDDTRLLAGPGRDDADLEDFEGKQAIAVREGDGAAESLALQPKRLRFGPGKGGHGMRPPGPPPGFAPGR